MNDRLSLLSSCSMFCYSGWMVYEGSWEETGGGGGEWDLNQILLQELDYVSSSNPKAKTLQKGIEHTNQQHRNDPLKVINVVEKE
jgi:hypothetical protein